MGLDSMTEPEPPIEPGPTLGPDLATVEPVTCPLLGLAHDSRTRFTFATAAHRCHAGLNPSAMDLGYQGTFCLTAAYPGCRRFRAAQAAGRAHGPRTPPPSAAYAEAAGTPARIGSTGRRRRMITAAVLILGLAGVLAVVVYVGGNLVAGVLQGGSPTDGLATATPPEVAATPGAAATPGPTAEPTLRPTTRPTPSAIPTPTPIPTPLIHVVARGETLTSIAARYGVTVEAIQEANQILDPGLIVIGQRLVIPPPP